MAKPVKIFVGDPKRFKEAFATREGDHIYEGDKGFMESPLLSVKDNQVFQGSKGWFESPIATLHEGKVYKGKVVKIVDFGAFVNFFGKRDGLVHVSQIENRRLNHPSDVLKEGQEVKVKLLGFDDRGKVRLSMKVVDQETGEEMKKEEKADD